MIVARATFDEVLSRLAQLKKLSADTETDGLRPYHGSRLFSIILNDGTESFYLNFLPYQGLAPDWVLLPCHLEKLKALFAQPEIKWFFHRAKFDLHMLAQEGIEVAGEIHCTQSLGRVVYNEHLHYDLASSAERIGLKKDDTVEKYIEANRLSEKRQGANRAYTHKFYDRVPFEIISPYGEQDAAVTYRLGESQEKALQEIADETPPDLPSVLNIAANEKRLTRTVFRMERVGLRIDRPYCLRASRFEADRAEKAMAGFKGHTGQDLKNSPKLFADVFADERERWGYTDEGNPSFDSDNLKKLANPAAQDILEYRDAKSKGNFYNGFLYHADSNGDVHPNFNQDGTVTGRFSSSEPNFQNLTSEEDAEEIAQEFVVRRAIIPRPGYIFIMPDFDQMEYRMMFDYACKMVGYESELVKKIKSGVDPHQATADLVTALGVPLSRKKAKNGNFALLYGSGDRTLAATVGGTVAEARALRTSILTVAPEIKVLVDSVMRTAETRGFIRNWAGRRFYCPNSRFAYQFPNRLIQGGTADVNKIALNRTDEYFLGMKSRLIATIHDENPCEIHESEVQEAPKRVKELMESVYPFTYLPLTVGMEWSARSLGDKQKGFPV